MIPTWLILYVMAVGVVVPYGLYWVVSTLTRLKAEEASKLKTFEAKHLIHGKTLAFNEENAPDWLTSAKTVKGSTMDTRWFWRDHVLTLPVDAFVMTDFWIIRRIS